MDLLNRIRRRQPGRRLDPAAPHAFQSIDQLAAPAATNPLGLGGTQAPILGLAADAMRGTCRLPGCGRPANDAVHM
jgi:hypothetical protein